MPADADRRGRTGREERLAEVADTISPPATVLVAGTVDPTEHVLGLGLLFRTGSSDDAAIVVTTMEGREAVVARARDAESAGGVPSLAVVDTVSEDQYLTAPYADVPTVYMPSADDLERVVIGLSDLAGTAVASTGIRHFVIRSLTPMIEGASAERVRRVLERMTGLRVGAGLGIFGVDFTTHDEATMDELTKCVDRLLWVSEEADGELQFDLRTTGRRLDY